MEKAEIVEAARVELARLSEGRWWMTARNLASRLRRHNSGSDELSTLSQIRLFDVLLEHSSEAARVVRNSRWPSERTLEPLWGAIERVGEKNVEPPIKQPDPEASYELFRRQHERSDRPNVPEAVDRAPEFFFSYNFTDSVRVGEIVATLELRGHSVWMAGNQIACGQHINRQVKDAIENAREMLLYLSSNALQSIWVAKEQLVGESLSLPRTLILNGEDERLMAQVQQWMNGQGEDERIPPRELLINPDRASYRVAARFYELLEEHLAAPQSVVYLHPRGRFVDGRRLRSIEQYRPLERE